MKLGAVVGMGDRPEEYIRRARELEAAGVDFLWTGEAYNADAVSKMGFLAAVTERAQIGSSILPLFTRTPSLLAMTAVGVDKLSNGRCVLGIGASGPQVIENARGGGQGENCQSTGHHRDDSIHFIEAPAAGGGA